jgi:multiple sugar transport system permease protein
MYQTFVWRLTRDLTAVFIVCLYTFPLFWWGLTAIKPNSAVYTTNGIVFFDFVPTLDNFNGAIFADLNLKFNMRQPLLDTMLVATGATLIALGLALPAAFGLTHFSFKMKTLVLRAVFALRILPIIAVIIPLVFLYHATSLLDTRGGLMLAHTVVNLPLAVLLLKSFFEDIPKEVSEAATIDGASHFEIFYKIQLPLIKAGIAATALLCFLFSWTEFLLSVFLTHSIQMLPLQLLNVVSWTWGFTAASSTASLVPGFIFILLIQKHLARGLTWGLQRS